MSGKDKKVKQLDFPKRYENDPWLLHLQRKVRNINKKIAQAEDLKAMKRDGKSMEPEQLDKIHKSAEFPQRIAELQSAADDYVKVLQESKQEEKKSDAKKADTTLRTVVSLLQLGAFLGQQSSRTNEQDAVVEIAQTVASGKTGSNVTLNDSIADSLKTLQQVLGRSSAKTSNGTTLAAVLEAVNAGVQASGASQYVAKETAVASTPAVVEKKEAVKAAEPEVVEVEKKKKEEPIPVAEIEKEELAAVENTTETAQAEVEEEKAAATSTLATNNWHDDADDNSVNEEEVATPAKKEDDDFISVQSKSSSRKQGRDDRGGRGRGGRGRGRGRGGRGEGRGRGNFRGGRGNRRGGKPEGEAPATSE